jgi:hypothetical protein
VKKPDCILIDDDSIIHTSWSLTAECMGKEIAAFESLDAFLKCCEDFDRDVPVYVDYCLGAQIDGGVAAKIIVERGFRDVFIATGRALYELAPMDWVKGVVGKDPPFFSW